MPLELRLDRNIPENAARAFALVCRLVAGKYATLGVPADWISGPVSFEWRKPDDLANGSYDLSSDVVSVLLPQLRAVDIPWVVTHEVAHRIWFRALSEPAKAEWSRFIASCGTPLQPEAIRSRVGSVANGKPNAFWFWYRKNHGDDLAGFGRFLKSVKYVPSSLPRDYSNVSPGEAWADVVANMVLGRSHTSTLMRQSGSQARNLALRLLISGKTSKLQQAEQSMIFYRTRLLTVESREDTFVRTRLLIIEEPTSPQSNTAVSVDQPGDSSDVDDDTDTAETENETQEGNSDDLIIDVQQLSETSEEFNDQIKKAIVGIPDALRVKLKEKGWTVGTCKHLGEVIQATSEQPPVPWNMVSIVININEQQIIVSEASMDNNGGEIPSLNPDGLLRNAIGHVVDSMAPEFVTEHFHDDFSDLESFKYAHGTDVTRLAGDKKQKLAMYTEDGDTSRAECFAEGFAALHGGGSIYTIDVMSKYFPAAMKQIKDILEAVDTGTPLDNADQGDAQDQADEVEPTEVGGPSQQVQGTQVGQA